MFRVEYTVNRFVVADHPNRGLTTASMLAENCHVVAEGIAVHVWLMRTNQDRMTVTFCGV